MQLCSGFNPPSIMHEVASTGTLARGPPSSFSLPSEALRLGRREFCQSAGVTPTPSQLMSSPQPESFPVAKTPEKGTVKLVQPKSFSLPWVTSFGLLAIAYRRWLY